jgi:MSHA biogenesis protein MshI
LWLSGLSAQTDSLVFRGAAAGDLSISGEVSKPLFGLLKKKVSSNALAAVCPSTSGISLARVRREPDLPPVLEACEYLAASGGEHAAALAKLRRQHDLDAYDCVSVAALGSYQLLLVEAPDVQPAELRAAIRWRVKDLIDFHLDDAVIDVFEVPNQKTAGRNRMMYAVVARADRVRQRIDSINQAGINLTVIDIPELALRNIAALLPEDVSGVALLYLENDAGLITITRQSTLYLSRQIDTGIGDLPDTVDTANDDEARGRLDSIVVEIQRSLDYYESHFSQPAVSGVVIAPLSRPVPAMLEYLDAQLDLSVRMLDLNQLIDMPAALDEAAQARCLLAIGAALREEARVL